MSTSNLWGELPETETTRTPLQILNEQASALTQMTNGVLVGFVYEAHQRWKPFAYELGIRAPALNEYSITVLSIYHDLVMYPIQVLDSLRNHRFPDCNDETSFLDALKETLQSPESRKVIAALLHQSNSVGTADPLINC